MPLSVDRGSPGVPLRVVRAGRRNNRRLWRRLWVPRDAVDEAVEVTKAAVPVATLDTDPTAASGDLRVRLVRVKGIEVRVAERVRVGRYVWRIMGSERRYTTIGNRAGPRRLIRPFHVSSALGSKARSGKRRSRLVTATWASSLASAAPRQ